MGKFDEVPDYILILPGSFRCKGEAVLKISAAAKKSMRQDLNLRPLRPERSALPN